MIKRIVIPLLLLSLLIPLAACGEDDMIMVAKPETEEVAYTFTANPDVTDIVINEGSAEHAKEEALDRIASVRQSLSTVISAAGDTKISDGNYRGYITGTFIPALRTFSVKLDALDKKLSGGDFSKEVNIQTIFSGVISLSARYFDFFGTDRSFAGYITEKADTEKKLADKKITEAEATEKLSSLATEGTELVNTLCADIDSLSVPEAETTAETIN